MRTPSSRSRRWLRVALVLPAAALLAVFAGSPAPRAWVRQTLAPNAGGWGASGQQQLLASVSGPPKKLITANAPAGRAALGRALAKLEERQMHSPSDADWARLTRASGSLKTEELRKRVRASSGPLIASVKTDREQLCAGDTLLVEAETFHSETEIWINGTRANPATVQLHQPGRRFVYVRAEGGARAEDADLERIAVEVSDCATDQSLMVSATPSPVHAPTVIVRALLPPPAPGARDALAGYSFLYDFGDGVVEQSSYPLLQHTYAPTGEERPVHYIKVTATDAHGKTTSGRTLYSYRHTKDTPAAPPPMPEWMKPQGDPLVEARRSRDRAEGLRALPEAYRTGRAKPPEGPLGQPQAWAQQPVPATSDDGVKPH